VTGALFPGERVLWTGKPQHARLTTGQLAAGAFFLAGAAQFALAGAWWLAASSEAFRLFQLAMFALSCLGCLCGAFYVLYVRRRLLRATEYQITDRRVIATTGGRTASSDSVHLDRIGEPTLRPHRDGSADLIFGIDRELPSDPVKRLVTTGRLGSAQGLVFARLHDAECARTVAVEAKARFVAGPVTDGFAARVSATPGERLPEAFQLGAGERILWVGRPERNRWWYGSDLSGGATGAVILVAAWSLAADVAAPGDRGPLVAALVGSLLGSYLLVGRLVHRRLLIGRSTYVLTDRRLVLGWHLLLPVMVDRPLVGLGPPVLAGESGGTADIMFAGTESPLLQAIRGGGPGFLAPVSKDGSPTLVGVRNPAAVRDMIAAAQLAARSLPAPPEPGTWYANPR
jgi:hypothetical protein